MGLLSWIRGAVDGSGKSLATLEVTVTGEPGAGKGHVELVQVVDADDDELFSRVTAAATLQELPTPGPTLLVSGDCKVDMVFMHNASGAARTVLLYDGSGTPRKVLEGFDLPPGSPLLLHLRGPKLLGGVKWGASGAGVWGYVIAKVK